MEEIKYTYDDLLQAVSSLDDEKKTFLMQAVGKYVIICTLPFKKTCRPSERHILFLLFGSESFR